MSILVTRNVTTLAGLCAWALLFADNVVAQEDPERKWSRARDVTTEEKLFAEVRATKPMLEQLASMTRPLNEAPTGPGHSLYTKSIILFDGETHTLIPVGSVLHLPANLRNRVIAKPQGDFTIWPDFAKKNAAWVGGKEVPLKMAKGDAKLAAQVLREVENSTRLLVSLYRQCPISVLEAPPPQTSAKP